MKSRRLIALLLAALMLLCLTACAAQDPGGSEDRFDEGSKLPFSSGDEDGKGDDGFTSAVISDPVLNDSSSIENSSAEQSSVSADTSPDRPQSSIDLPLSIDIWDYINADGEWDFYGMAEAIGWDNVTKDFPSYDPRVAKGYYENEDHKGTLLLQLWIPWKPDESYMYVDERTLYFVGISGKGQLAGVSFIGMSPNNRYRVMADNVDLYVPLEAIISAAYIMENIEDDAKGTLRQAFQSGDPGVDTWGPAPIIACN